MRTKAEGRQVLRPAQVARMFGVTDITVNKWADDGLIPSFRTPGGQRRFWADEIEDHIDASRPPAAS
jgi:excisionase family DNA binding protein